MNLIEKRKIERRKRLNFPQFTPSLDHFVYAINCYLETADEYLDRQIISLVRNHEKVPQYLQVISKEEIEVYEKEALTDANLKRKIQCRLEKQHYLSPTISGGLCMGSKLSKKCPPAHFYEGPLEHYCNLMGNGYRK